jgi:hypothetical protein
VIRGWCECNEYPTVLHHARKIIQGDCPPYMTYIVYPWWLFSIHGIYCISQLIVLHTWHIYIQYTYIVGKYWQNLWKARNDDCFCHFYLNLTSFPTLLTLQDKHKINFIFNDNVRILCLSCNVKKVEKLVRFKQKGIHFLYYTNKLFSLRITFPGTLYLCTAEGADKYETGTNVTRTTKKTVHCR